jgi:hypothetical protein
MAWHVYVLPLGWHDVPGIALQSPIGHDPPQPSGPPHVPVAEHLGVQTHWPLLQAC